VLLAFELAATVVSIGVTGVIWRREALQAARNSLRRRGTESKVR
jgi:hypothetical protein